MGFLADERAQSVQIGAVLLFGILMIGFSMHQAYVIPNQNQDVEFNHFSETQGSLEELRNDLVAAGQDRKSVPASVELGTSYPSRMVAAQPQRSTGALRAYNVSDDEYEIQGGPSATMTDICGIDPVDTSAITYDPSYNYLDSIENVTLENTVTYTNGESAGRSFQTDHQLVEGTTVHVYPLVGEFDRGGGDVTSTTLQGNKTGSKSYSGSFSLVVPTKLTADEWEQELLTEQSHVSGVSSPGDDTVKINFDDAEYRIKCSPVGVGEDPNNDPVYEANDETGDGNGDGAFSIDWEDPSSQSGTESTCNTDECTWNLTDDSDSSFTLTATTDPTVENMDVEFGVDNTSVATIASSDDTTNSTGKAAMDLNAQANGTLGAYVATGGTSEVINLTLTHHNPNAVGSVPKEEAYAYDDKNDNLEYDPEEDLLIPKEDIYDYSDDTANLVIPSDVGEISENKIDITANKITSRVDMTSNGKKLELQSDQKKIDLTGTSLTSTSTSKSITLSANDEAEIDITDANIDSEKNVEMTGATKVSMNGSTVKAVNKLTVSTDSSEIEASNSHLESEENSKRVKLESAGDILITNSNIIDDKGPRACVDQDSDTLYLDAAEVEDTDDNEQELDHNPDAQVEGDLDKGSLIDDDC